MYGKTCVNLPLSKRPKNCFQGQLSFNAGQKYCNVLQGELHWLLYTIYHLSLMFCLFLSGCFTVGVIWFVYMDVFILYSWDYFIKKKNVWKKHYVSQQMSIFCTTQMIKEFFLYHYMTYECVTKNLNFLFLNQNICCGYSKEPSQWDSSFEHPKHMLKLTDKKIFIFLRWKILFIWTCALIRSLVRFLKDPFNSVTLHAV